MNQEPIMKRFIDYATSQQGALTIVLTMMVLGSVLALLNAFGAATSPTALVAPLFLPS